LKLPYKKKKDSRPQVGPLENVRIPKDSPAMQTCMKKILDENLPRLKKKFRRNNGRKP
jgi:hypothetical protein